LPPVFIVDARLTGADKELVMGRALCDWIGWQ